MFSAKVLISDIINLDFFNFLFSFFLFFFIERAREGERERNIKVWLPLVCPLLGTWPATQACALTGNWTWHPFGLQAGTQFTLPQQPVQISLIFCVLFAYPQNESICRSEGLWNVCEIWYILSLLRNKTKHKWKKYTLSSSSVFFILCK